VETALHVNFFYSLSRTLRTGSSVSRFGFGNLSAGGAFYIIFEPGQELFSSPVFEPLTASRLDRKCLYSLEESRGRHPSRRKEAGSSIEVRSVKSGRGEFDKMIEAP
jgi:hypothetical protein